MRTISPPVITWINTHANAAKNYLILDFTVNSGNSTAVWSVKCIIKEEITGYFGRKFLKNPWTNKLIKKSNFDIH